VWAAYIALVNASSACRGLPIGFANPALYRIAGSNYAGNFHDITEPSPFTGAGSNDTLDQFRVGSSDPSFLYPVRAGYDMSTGLGSMIAPALAGALCSLRSPVYTVRVADPGAQLSKAGHRLTLQIHGSDSGGQGLTYRASGLPAGLAINPSTGEISGTPTKSGTSTVAVVAEDQFTNSGTTQFSWKVVKPAPPTVSRLALSGVASRKPKLSFTVAAGAFSPALASVVISPPSGLGFSNARTALAKGISVSSAGRRLKFKARVGDRTLTLTFAEAVQQASVTIGPPDTGVTAAVAAQARRRKPPRVTIDLKLVDTSARATRIDVQRGL